MVSLQSRDPGSTVDFTLSGSSASGNGFSPASFSLAASGADMTGGTGNSIYSAGVSYLPNSDLDESYDSVNGSWKYTYDDFNRLNTAVSNTGLGCAEVYDRFGNRLQQTNYTGTCMTPNYTLQTGKYWISGFSYDLAGDMIGDGIHSYQYDAEGRLASVDSGSTASYVYDAGGTRVRRIVGGVAYDDVYDLGGHVISDFLASGGTWNRGEVYAGGMHLATYIPSTANTYFVHSDWLGTERVRSGAGGAIYSTWTSYPFGEGSLTSNPSPAHFTGKERDAESGNDYFGARYYSSSMGRFMSPDRTPFGIAPGDPQSWNLYSYARNKPTTAIDVGGSWYTPIHKQMVDISLNGIMSAGEIAQLQHRQDVMDANASGMDDQRGHYMALPGQDPQVAKNNSDNLIDSNIAAASQGTDASGNMSSGALDHLGDAMHTLEDMTSPMHTTDNGTPLVWYGNFGHFGTNGVLHWMGENDASDSWARFGQAIRLTLAAYVQANPVGAGKHGLNGDNFMKEADRRTSEYVTQYYNMYRASEPEAEAARQCALGNPAACDH